MTTTRSSTLSVSSSSSSISLLSMLPCNNDDLFNLHDSTRKADATSATQDTTTSAEESDYQRVLILERVSKMLMNQRDYESSLNKLQMAMSILKSWLDLQSSRRAHDSMWDDSDFKTINLEETLQVNLLWEMLYLGFGFQSLGDALTAWKEICAEQSRVGLSFIWPDVAFTTA